jgi:hypothetical protein
MINRVISRFTSLAIGQKSSYGFANGEGAEFLVMVEKYFDHAGKYTNIRPDILNFYKKADNVVKFNLTLTRGIFNISQMTSPFRSFLPIDANIRHINCPLKEELDTLRM